MSSTQTKKTKKKTTKKSKKIKQITYKDIEDIVEYLVRTKSYNYSFDCYAPADIAQEIRIICLKALKHFDIDRVVEDKWQNFFGRCVDNGLKNLKRDKYLRTTSPCKSDCELLHGDEHLNGDLGSVCKRWLKFRKTLQCKINIKHPLPIGLLGDIKQKTSFDEEIEAKDLKQHLFKMMDKKLRPSLKKMLNGNAKKVSKENREKIQEKIAKFIEDYTKE